VKNNPSSEAISHWVSCEVPHLWWNLCCIPRCLGQTVA